MLDTPGTPVDPDDFKRNHNGWPIIRGVPYKRMSGLGKPLEDTFQLEAWRRRNVAHGLAYDPSLVARVVAVGGTPHDWDKPQKQAVTAICDDAEHAAKAHSRRDTGTALHAILERFDQGDPTANAGPYQAELDAYQQAMQACGLTVGRSTEIKVVNHSIQGAGTCDNLVKDRSGRLMIADKKTGSSVLFSGISIAAQLAGYAGGQPWDARNEVELEWPGAIDQTTGIVMHIAAGEGRCDIYTVDLAEGREAIDLAAKVTSVRNRSKKWLQVVPPVVGFGSAQQVEPTPHPPSPCGGVGSLQTPSPEHLAACQQVRDQIMSLNDIDRATLASRWDTTWGPTNVLKTPEKVTPETLEAIAALVNECDPFANVNPTPVAPREQPARVTVSPLPTPVDDSKRMTNSDIENLRRRLGRLDGDQAAWVWGTLKASDLGGMSALHMNDLTERKWHLISGLILLAVNDFADDEVLEAALFTILGEQDMMDGTHTLGEWLATLDPSQAQRFHDLASHITGNTAQLLVTDDGHPYWTLSDR